VSTQVKNAFIGVLYLFSVGFVVAPLAGDYFLPVVLSVLAAASVVVFALLGGRWWDHRRARIRLADKYDLSSYDARMAMHLVDSGQVMRAALRPAGRDYAEHQLERARTPVWVPVLGVVLALAVFIPYAALLNARVLAFIGIGTVGYQCYRTYTRPDRLQAALAKLTGASQAPEANPRGEVIPLPRRAAPVDRVAPARPSVSTRAASSTADIELRGDAVPSQITLQRSFTWRNSLAEYIVEIDGHRVGRLRPRASKMHEVRPGKHEIRVHFDTTGYPEKGYMGSPTFEINLQDGESEVLDVIPTSSMYLSQMRGMHEDWLMLTPADDDPTTVRPRPPVTGGAVLRFLLTGVVGAALLANWFVFSTGSPAWSVSDAIVLIGAGILIYLRFVKK